MKFTVGVLTPLTAAGPLVGTEWDESARLAVLTIQQALQKDGLTSKYQISAATQDDGGTGTQGIQSAKVLVNVDHATMVLPVLSGVTIPVAQSVTIPGNVIMFTGGTSPAISTLSSNGLVFRTTPSDGIQANVLAQIMGQALGSSSTVNILASNDAGGAGLATAFQTSWTKAGGKVGQMVLYSLTQATYDTEAQKAVSGNPAGWLVSSQPDYWAKIYPAIVRTGKFDATKAFGAESFFCQTYTPAGMRATAADTSSGPGVELYHQIWLKNAPPSLPYQGGQFYPEAFDDTIIAFLASVAAKSTLGTDIAKKVRSVVTPATGVQSYGIDNLAGAIAALDSGKQATYIGAVGVQGFDQNGDPLNPAYDVATSTGPGGAQGPDGPCTTQKVTYTP